MQSQPRAPAPQSQKNLEGGGEGGGGREGREGGRGGKERGREGREGREGEVNLRSTCTHTHSPIMSDKLDSVISMATLDTVDTDCISVCTLTRQTAIEVVHRIRVVTGDGKQTLARLEGII